MPLDPILAADIRSWLQKARIDLRSVEAALSVEPPVLEDAVFHCQQAVEKTLKAFLTWGQVSFPKTHDLRFLAQACVTLDGALEPLLDEAAPLSWYAWKYRYPGDEQPPSLEEAQRSWEIARQVYAAILSRLPPEARV